VNYVFKGNTTYGAVCAVVVANGVLLGYILAAIAEDKGEAGDGKKTK